MEYIKVCLAACCLTGLLFSENAFSESVQDPERNIPNVIIITLSGVRNTESISDPEHQYFPHLWKDMIKEGMLYTDVICVEQEFHMTAFNAINTGQNALLFYKIRTPTIFQYVRKQYGWPAHKFLMVGHWQGIEGYCETDEFREDTYPSEISLGIQFSKEFERELSEQELLLLESLRLGQKKFSGFNFNNWDAFDCFSYRLFKKLVPIFHPKLIHYSLGGADVAHYDSYSRYVLTLKMDDEIIYGIWRMIQTDPFYKDNTYLFVCPDDERNAYYRYHDSNARDNPCHVWLYAFGPGVKKGVTVSRPIYHIDIFSTVARIMKTNAPPIDSKVLSEVFSFGSKEIFWQKVVEIYSAIKSSLNIPGQRKLANCPRAGGRILSNSCL
ncbi:MAG TPA: hypothetical protein PL125_05105 [Candidatus Omnitrophota bacterium]|nr:hypothetical protein [Candidatus Omnitrophota bacterium]HPT39555.1 hypothetical protein [Candidatus Omnitrophota bacterium]